MPSNTTPIPVTTTDDDWTEHGVDWLMIGDIVLIRERVEILDRTLKIPGTDKHPPKRDPKNPKRLVHGWRRTRAEVVALGCALSNHPLGHGDHRGFDRLLILEVLASDGDEPDEPGRKDRNLLQRNTTLWSRTGREKWRMTYRLEGSGPTPRQDDWRKQADEQADNLKGWADMRERIREQAKAEKIYPAYLVGRLHETTENPHTQDPKEREEILKFGASIWGGQMEMDPHHRRTIRDYLDRQTRVPLRPGDDIL